MSRDEEFYQAAIELTTAQAKAFVALQRAVKACEKANVFFYQNLESLGALNGNNVHSVGCSDDFSGHDIDSPNCLQYKSFPTVRTACSYADDNHFLLLHDE